MKNSKKSIDESEFIDEDLEAEDGVEERLEIEWENVYRL